MAVAIRKTKAVLAVTTINGRLKPYSANVNNPVTPDDAVSTCDNKLAESWPARSNQAVADKPTVIRKRAATPRSDQPLRVGGAECIAVPFFEGLPARSAIFKLSHHWSRHD